MTASATIVATLERKEFSVARQLIESRLADDPRDGEMWFLLGIAQRGTGDARTAVTSYRRALETHGQFPDIWFNLGNALSDLPERAAKEQALLAYAEAIRRQGSFQGALERLTALARLLGKTDVALIGTARLLALSPEQWTTRIDHLRSLREAGQVDEAFTLFQQWLPQGLEVTNLLIEGGHLLEAKGDHRALCMLYQRLDELQPGNATIKFHLGLNRLRVGQNTMALASLREAEALGMTERALWVNLGTALSRVDRVEEALSYMQRAAPDFQTDPASFVFAFALKQKLCDWSGYETLRQTMLQPALQHAERALGDPPANSRAYPALPFPFTAFPGPINESEQQLIARAFAAFVAKGIVPHSGYPWRGQHSRIRIGYLSADFHDHATAHLMLGMFKRHNRSRFEVVAYSYGPDDGTHYRERIRSEVDRFVDLTGIPDRDAAARIYADQLDVLVDLKGYTREARTALLAYRPAPVQVEWLGYPGSMGADFVDYALVDADVVPPEQARHYTERLLYMPASYQVNDDEQAIAPLVPTRKELGLPEKAFVFCSFCAHYKLEPVVFDLWMKILRAVPGSVLWLIDGYLPAREALSRRAEKSGINPARLIFAPREKKAAHLARHAAADLFLDTFAYNAHTTMSDALWAGVPAITCEGNTFSTRVGAGLLRSAGFSELIASNHDGYLNLAVELARNKPRLHALRERLRLNRMASPLFDTFGFVQDWESRLVDIAAPNPQRVRESELHIQGLQAVMNALSEEDNTKALAAVENLLDAGCDRPDAWNAYAVALRRTKQHALAHLVYRHGLRLKPDYGDMMGNYGNLLREEDRLDEALLYFRRAVTFSPAGSARRTALSNLASALSANAQPAEQLAVLEEALKIAPDDADLRWDKALALLMQGRVGEGLIDYESRFDRKNPPPRAYSAPLWTGGELAGKTLFLHWEQGYGDTIQFLRFVPVLADRGARIVLEVQPGLKSLVATLPGVVDVVEAGVDTALPPFDCWSSLLSVPLRLGIEAASLPVRSAYLRADHDRRVAWRHKLDTSAVVAVEKATKKKSKGAANLSTTKPRTPRVGLIWAGNPNVKNDRLRSPRLAPLLPLFELPGVEWILLQQGDGRRDLAGIKLPANVRDLAPDIRDFADTAAVMAELDLVISTDTSTAHLAAAMGCPTWVLLHYASDWRWGLGEKSLWYPEARLFRQHALADWSPVVDQLRDALSARFGAGVSGPRPVVSRALQKKSPDATFEQPFSQPSGAWVEAAFGLYQRGRMRLARRVVRAALTADPTRPDAWCLLGVVARNLENYQEAERAYRQALAVSPDYVDCWFNLGNLFRHQKKWAEAQPVYERVLALEPRHASALNLLSDVVRELQDLPRAEALAREAIAVKPDYAEAWGHLGNALNDLERFAEAAECYDRALGLPECPPETRYNKGVALQRARQIEAALVCYRQILTTKPQEVPAHYNLATSLLTLGEFGEGFAEYEWRLKKPDLLPRPYAKPFWLGEALAGRTLFLYWEQGCGDTLQFLRFIPLIEKQGGRIVVEVQHGLGELAGTVQGVDQVVEGAAGEVVIPAFDCHASILSVAALLGVETAAGPALPVRPYLTARQASGSLWLDERRQKRVGLVWAGNPEVKNDRVRSPRLGPLRPLFDVPGVTWVILQKGDGRRDLESVATPEGTLDPAVDVKTFADTAAIMSQLDLVISSDTSTAHLAPALGIPTWVLLHFAADWRWMSGERTAWYPAVPLFRQAVPGDWETPVAAMAAALREWVNT